VCQRLRCRDWIYPGSTGTAWPEPVLAVVRGFIRAVDADRLPAPA
jgi:hypothetical protein